tara:strand:- start:13 stop:291 length:279 start_codon:yes stop_codon:yes gene_type:complete
MVLKQDVYMKNLFSLYRQELGKIKLKDLEVLDAEDEHTEFELALDRAKHQWAVFENNTPTLKELDAISLHLRNMKAESLCEEEEHERLAGVH